MKVRSAVKSGSPSPAKQRGVMMRRICFCAVIFFVSIYSIAYPRLLRADPLTALAPETIDGTIEVIVIDYLDKPAEEVVDLVRPNHQRIRLNFPGKRPDHIRTGAKVTVSGIRTVDQQALAVADSTVTDTPSVAQDYVVGLRSLAVIRVFSADVSVRCSRTTLDNLYWLGAQNVRGMYEATSYGAISYMSDFNADGQSDIFDVTLPYSTTGACDYGRYSTDASAALLSQGINVNNWNNRVYVIPASCGWAGLGILGTGSGDVWIPEQFCNVLDVVTHEIGHNNGLQHARLDPDNDEITDCSNIAQEYGDWSCPMGIGGVGARFFNAVHAYQESWIPPGKVVSGVGGGSFTIAPVELDPAASSYPSIIKVPRPAGNYYFISYRDAIGSYSSGLQSAYRQRISIHSGGNTPGASYLITTLDVGASWSDPLAALTIQFISRGVNSATIAVSGVTTYSISGDLGTTGATVGITGATGAVCSAATAPATTYSCSGIPQGATATITPALSGYTFLPLSRTFTSIAQNFTAQNFSAQYSGSYPSDIRKLENISIINSARVLFDFTGLSTRTDGWAPTVRSIIIDWPGGSTGVCPDTASYDIPQTFTFLGFAPNTTYNVSMQYENGKIIRWKTFTTPALSPETVPPEMFGLEYRGVFEGHQVPDFVAYTDGDNTLIARVEFYVGNSSTPFYTALGVDTPAVNHGYWFFSPVPTTLNGDTLIRARGIDIFGNYADISATISISAITPYIITGFITPGGNVSIVGGGTCTVVLGTRYTCSAIPYGSTVTITPALTGFAFSPASRTFTNIAQNFTAQNFAGTINRYSITGAVTAGATISIVGGGSGSCGADGGSYTCTGIPWGASVTITPSKTGYSFTPPFRSYANINGNLTAQDFIGAPISYSISGYVATGATMAIVGTGSCSVVTGYYTCSGIPYGATVTLTPSKPGYTFTPLSRTFTNVAQNFTAQNFSGTINTYSITGSLTAGAAVSIVGGGTCSAGGGSYTCSNIPYGNTVVITPSLVAYTFAPASRTHANVTQSLSGQNFTGTLITYSISGSVTTGSAVTIAGGGSCAVTAATYTCTGVPYGAAVTITPSKTGYSFTPPFRNYSSITSNLTGQDFVGMANTFSIFGSVPTATTINIVGGGSCAVGNSSYTCSGIPFGSSVTITPSLPGYTFTPTSRTHTNVGQDLTGQDFTATINTYSITGSITTSGTVSIVGGGSCSVSGSVYTCSNIPYGSTVVITPSLLGYIFTPTSRTHANVTQSLSGQNFTGTLVTYSISGAVVTGSAVAIVGGGSCAVIAATYTCTGVPYGAAVTITPSKAGYSFTPPFRSYPSITDNLSAQDFVGIANTFSITGSVPTGATVGIVGGGSCAVGNNSYTCSAIPFGATVTLTPSLPGYTLMPASRTHSNVVQNVTGQDFVSSLPPDPVVGEGALVSPLYALWNGFLRMNNVLELFNTGAGAFTVTLTMYDMTGKQVDTKAITLSGHTKQEIIVNNLKGFKPDSYGLIKLTFPGTALNGGMYFYKPNTNAAALAGDDFDFTFAVPFENTLHGPTYVGFNTFHPSTNPLDSGGSVFNWLSIVNLDPLKARSFTVMRYDRNGQLLSTKTLRIPSLGRVDVDGGHGEGRNVVGLNKITPENNNILYKAELIRYGTRGNSPSSYSFAFPLLPTAPGGTEQWVSISSGGQGRNWIEVINTLNKNVAGSLVFYDNAGHIVFQDNQTLRLLPRQQKHFNASAVLPPGFSGAARIRFNKPGALVSQSMFYFFDPSGSVTAMYGVPGTKSDTGTLAGSWNLRFNMYNWLRVFNTSAQSQTVTLKVYNGSASTTKRYTLSPFHGTDLPLHDTGTFKTATNSSGVLTISGNSLQAEILRYKPTATGGIDYIEETPVSAR